MEEPRCRSLGACTAQRRLRISAPWGANHPRYAGGGGATTPRAANGPFAIPTAPPGKTVAGALMIITPPGLEASSLIIGDLSVIEHGVISIELDIAPRPALRVII